MRELPVIVVLETNTLRDRIGGFQPISIVLDSNAHIAATMGRECVWQSLRAEKESDIIVAMSNPKPSLEQHLGTIRSMVEAADAREAERIACESSARQLRKWLWLPATFQAASIFSAGLVVGSLFK